MYFRGDRGLAHDGVESLRREMEVLRALAAHGIPVSHVYGFCETVPGIVMETSPGRANLATAESERRAPRRARPLPRPARARSTASIPPCSRSSACRARARPPSAASATSRAGRASTAAARTSPSPAIELTLRWLRENVPTHRDRVSCLVGDSGQFLFDRGRVTAVLDVELATLGDPLADLGALLSRDLSEPLGDLSRGIARYRERTGETFERRDVLYQAVRFCIVTPLSICFLCAQPPPGLNLAQYESWNLVYGRVPLELIAELEGIAIERARAARAARPPTRDRVRRARRAARRARRRRPAAAYQLDTARRVAQYAREIDRRGARLEEQDLEEAARAARAAARPSWREADAELERRAIAAGRDERRALRALPGAPVAPPRGAARTGTSRAGRGERQRGSASGRRPRRSCLNRRPRRAL